jgi:hypothetical protein
MKLYTDEVTCLICPHRCAMKYLYKDEWNEEYEDRFVCTNETPAKEIKLHESIDAPDWCKLPDVTECENDQDGKNCVRS